MYLPIYERFINNIESNLMRLKLFQDNWEQFGNNSLTLQCSIQKLN